jgi:putative membrane protein
MKKLRIGFLLLCWVYFFSACSGDSSKTESTSTTDSTLSSATTTDSTPAVVTHDSTPAATAPDTSKANNASVDTTNNNAGNMMVDQITRDFVADAATGGMMEVELGKLAAKKAKSYPIKGFGGMMVADHSTINNNLKNIASKKKIDLPASITDDQKMEIDNLSKKSGAAFDSAYVDMMIEDHKKDIDAFKKATGTVGDNDLKNFATNTLPTLQHHLDAIKAIKLGKSLTGGKIPILINHLPKIKPPVK